MPLGLLLQDVTTKLSAGTKKLERWSDLVWLEHTLIRRAQSAFLARWFGVDLPLDGLHLRLAIANLDSLQARYQTVMDDLERRRQAPEGLNLTGPTLGLVGGLAGAVFSPMGVAVLSIAALRSAAGSSHWLLLILYALGGLLIGGILSGLGIGLGVGIGVGLGVPLAVLAAPVLAAQPAVQRLYSFMGALAEMLDAMSTFLRQLLGPREGARNPLVRRLLELGDRLSLLVPHLAGALAFVVVRVGAAVRALVDQLPAFIGLIRETVNLVALLLSDLAWHLARLFTGRTSIMANLGVMLDALKEFGEIFVAVFEIMPGDLAFRFRDWWQTQEGQILGWWKAAKAAVMDRLEDHPFGAAITEGIRRFTLARDAFASMATATPPSSSPPDLLGRTWARMKADLVRIFTPPALPTTAQITARAGGAPALPLSGAAITKGADIRAFTRGALTNLLPGPMGQELAQLLAYTPFTISAATRKQLDRARSPRSAFVVERARLRDADGRTPTEQFARLREQERPFREALYQVVAHILPREVSAYVVELDDVFRLIDQHLYEHGAPDRQFEAPVKAILQSRRLQPIVRRLVVRAPGSEDTAIDRAGLSAWTDGLRATLEQQAYVAAD